MEEKEEKEEREEEREEREREKNEEKEEREKEEEEDEEDEEKEEDKEKIEQRKAAIKNKFSGWLRDPYTLIFIAIIIFAIVLRLYYFFLTSNQPLWWDESDYMAYAKNLAGLGTGWIIRAQHNSLFPLLVVPFFKLGLSDVIVKFVLVLLPSILLVFLTYKICTLMYKDKKIALISSFLMATFWNILFNSVRFHVGALGLLFAFLAIYSFWQGYEKKQRIFKKLGPNWALPLTAIFLILAYATRRGYFLFILFFLFYFVFAKNLKKFFSNKYTWIAIALALILFFFIEKTVFTELIFQTSSAYYTPETPFNLVPFQIFGTYFKTATNSWFSPLFYLFYLGLLVLIINLALSVGYIKKNSKIRSDFFVFLMVILTLAYFLFFQRGSTIGDPRWYFPLLLGSFICISKGTLLITNFIKKYNKLLAVVILLLLIGYGGYYEMQHGNMIIKAKINSYSGIKQTGLYLKEIAGPSDTFISVAVPQPAYYGELPGTRPWEFINKETPQETSLEEFLEELQKEEHKNVRFLIVTFSEPNHPEWMRQEEYTQHPQTGQVVFSKWKIPFMDSTIDFLNNEQDIKESKTYGNLEFRLLQVFEDSFLYGIVRK